MNTHRAECLLLLVTIIAALGWIFSKHALEAFSPYQFVAIRFSLAALVLFGFSAQQFKRLTRKQLMQSVILGTILGISMLAWVMGLKQTRFIGEGAFIISLSVILVPIIGRLLFREPVAHVLLIALPPAIIGLSLLKWQAIGQPAVYQLLFFITAICFSFHISLSSHLENNTPLCLAAAIQLSITAFIAYIAIMIDGHEDWPLTTSIRGWTWLLCSALLSTSLRYLLQMRILQSLAPNHASMILLAEPIWTAMLGLWLLDEHMSSMQWLGCMLIFSAVLVYRGHAMVHRQMDSV